MRTELDQIKIAAGTSTDELVSFIFRELDDDIVDQIDLERASVKPEGVARELVTTAAVLTLASTLTVSVVKLIARWLEQNRQRDAIELVYQASKRDPDMAKLLAELELKHADVMVQYNDLLRLRPKQNQGG